MAYVEILVAGTAYHGKGPLTYRSERDLPVGTVVSVPLRQSRVLGVVVRYAEKPSFPVKDILEALTDLPPIPLQLLETLYWMQQYYPSPLGVITQQFLPKHFPKKPPQIKVSDSLLDFEALPPLTPDQQAALRGMNRNGLHLLHGETGTGKTRIYIELAKRSMADGRSALILTPEIGLTSQLAQEFRQVFDDDVVVIHSGLAETTRQQLWASLLRKREPAVVIGARSALFSPLHRIGLIVIDEAHDTAYKQDQAPYYHATRVASKLAQLHNAALVLGSATPLVSDYFMAKAKNKPILRMTHLATTSSASEKRVSIVDLRDRSQFTKTIYLSDQLIKAIEGALDHGEQILLFLNRRGTARIVFCENCGWQALCPHCDLPLVYHGDIHKMRCHTCNYSSVSLVSCPDCHNASIIFRSVGTKAIADEINKLFPDAHVMRFDTDNKKSERIEQHYANIKNGNVDILVGTQTLAKGLDLPKLGLVGVVIADTGLYFPDFSAQERTYQLISQVLGRIGRGHRESQAIIQTYNPQSILLKSILKKDWQAFYEKEIEERKNFAFPPFSHLLKLTCRRASQPSAEKAAEAFARQLKDLSLRIAVAGPAPAFREKVLNKYQWQLVIKAKERSELLRVIALLPSGWSYDIDPMNLL